MPEQSQDSRWGTLLGVASAAPERARRDISEGRLWKARERLNGAARAFPHDQEVLELLGDVYLQMGDYPAAGRFWALTCNESPESRAAWEALKTEARTPAELLSRIPAREPWASYPEPVQRRLNDLRDQVSRGARREAEDLEADNTAAGVGSALTVALLVAATVGVWVVGVIAVVRFVTGL